MQSITKKRLAELSAAELKGSGVTIKTSGTRHYLSGKDRAIYKLTNKAIRRLKLKQWNKLGGKLATLCEPCEWLSLGYEDCRKCGGEQ
jgi:hypothetical protein